MKKISLIWIINIILYFIAVIFFFVTKTEMSLIMWELLTIVGAPITLFLLIGLSNVLKSEEIYKKVMIAFMSCACSLTSMAHIVNITVTRRLISEGVNVPNYFRIGYWPSVEMAVDYLAWGFFVGLAFLCIGLSAINIEKEKISIKRITIFSGILCLIGFFGTLFINENLWYLAPLGYGVVPIFICIKLLNLKK